MQVRFIQRLIFQIYKCEKSTGLVASRYDGKGWKYNTGRMTAGFPLNFEIEGTLA